MGLFWNKKYPLQLSSKDMHCHILPGVDDGFHTAEHSLEALNILSEIGVRDITFTPHMNPEVYSNVTEADLRRTYDSFCSKIPAEWGIRTALAAEYMLVKDFESRASDPDLLTFKDGSILIEMSYYFPSPNLEDAIFALVMAGKKPVLAHPERYLYMADELEKFDRIVESGCRLQMNYMSLSGAYGPQSMKILNHLLSRKMYSFISTDLHTLHQLESIRNIVLTKDLYSGVNELITRQSSE